VVSTALVVERAEEGHAYPVQHPVYFISEVLGSSKKKYPQVQKLLYAVLLTARKLRVTPGFGRQPNENYVRARIRTHVHSGYINEHQRTLLE
jgi:hypothetical protein